VQFRVHATFCYSPSIVPGSVIVEMSWRDGDRIGALLVPEDIKTQMKDRDYPGMDGDLRVESALAYAVYISLVARLPVAVTGDASVWDPRWGELQVMH
jgi:hypothetical protein